MALNHKSPYKGWVGWLDNRLPVIYAADKVVGTKHPTPKNLNYMWNFGSLAGICLIVQILTGIFLAMHYTAHVDMAFDSVERIMRDVNFGWLLRYIHAVGASMFFIVVYTHIFRGLYYGSYKGPREVLWWMGVIILILMMATAFMGYVLPWGQMSFWGATVITNLFSAFPLVGESIVQLLWGGFSVDNATLNRFFSLHYLMPFLLIGVVGLHILALNAHGSNNPLGIDVKSDKDTIPFHPYFTIKDMFGFGVFFLIFAWFVFFSPNSLGHADNYIEANPLVTPAHIVPEWYFLPFYAILRAVVFDIPLWLIGAGLAALPFGLRTLERFGIRLPFELTTAGKTGLISFGVIFAAIMYALGAVIESKLGGVLAMFGALIVLFFLPWLDFSKVRSARFRPVYRLFFWVLVADCILLGYLGAKPAEGIYVVLSIIGTAYYFAHFLVVMPLVSYFEKPLPLPESIHKPVATRKVASA